MPFTFSHPAIILPITFLPARMYSLTGLIVGSIIPDFEYFIRMRIRSEYSHTLEGLIWFCIPLGVLLCFVFHNVVRNSLFSKLPDALKSRLQLYTDFDWNQYFLRNWWLVMLCILLGATTHIVWDHFTHQHGYFVARFGALHQDLEILKWKFPVYKVIQHVSTFLGGAIVLLSIWQLPKKATTTNSGMMKYWGAVVVITSIILTARLLAGLNPAQYGHLIATVIASLMLSFLVIAIAQKLISRRE